MQGHHLCSPAYDLNLLYQTVFIAGLLSKGSSLFHFHTLNRYIFESSRATMDSNYQIVNFSEEYAEAFYTLNRIWIERHFAIVPEDLRILENPLSEIINAGGFIKVALHDSGQIVGVCAMKKLNGKPYDYELSKMAVDDNHQGKGIGKKLIQACIDQARKMEAKQIYLESNTALKPAIFLYKKMGFKKIKGNGSPYDRVDIYMKLDLQQ